MEFDKGSPVIRDTDFARLGRIAEVLKQSPHVRMVELHGHTDDGGDADPNLVLSQQRAEAVRAYLVNQGVEGTRLRSRAFGKTIPIAPNATPAGRAQNRRVEFRIVEQ
ncbi:MAG: OmpA family protein [Deltaproteobacteria bacterium]|nr:OmpA family protein [Deltaproteobacteria bacterium]